MPHTFDNFAENALIAAAAFVTGALIASNTGADAPALVGYGCEGAAADAVLYADSEDQFPACDRIERRAR